MLELLHQLLQLDVIINQMAEQFGLWLYFILFLIIFSETGLVIAPFLPGDSLLFAVGALSASSPHFRIEFLIPLLISASIMGDSTNYWIGRKFGRRLFETKHQFSAFFNPKYLKQTEDFYQQKGSIAVCISRFLPILRTFAPFVGGLTQMPYRRFVSLSVIGSIAWVNVFALAGYFFGRIPFIQQNFTMLVMGIVGFSLAPLLFGVIRNLIQKRL